jgi:hypothetical protein
VQESRDRQSACACVCVCEEGEERRERGREGERSDDDFEASMTASSRETQGQRFFSSHSSWSGVEQHQGSQRPLEDLCVEVGSTAARI